MCERRTDGHPDLPIDIYCKLSDKFGEEKATEILDKVQEKAMTIKEASALIES